jgi:hypothetical protein
MEMEGMGLNRREDREGYGRLEDDRDDDFMVCALPTGRVTSQIGVGRKLYLGTTIGGR